MELFCWLCEEKVMVNWRWRNLRSVYKNYENIMLWHSGKSQSVWICHRAAIGNYEREAREPGIEELILLADFFQVSLTILLEGLIIESNVKKEKSLLYGYGEHGCYGFIKWKRSWNDCLHYSKREEIFLVWG